MSNKVHLIHATLLATYKTECIFYFARLSYMLILLGTSAVQNIDAHFEKRK